MKQEVVLNVKTREVTTKGAVNELRLGGKIPAILYGNKEPTVPLIVNEKEFLKEIIQGERGENVIISLHLDDSENKPKNAIIKEIQIDPVKRNIIHVDFCQVSMTQEIEVNVPIALIGTPVGVESGGVVDHIAREMKVKCLPTQIPEKVELDISSLKIGDTLKIKDLKIPVKVEVLEQPEAIVVSIIAPTVLEEKPPEEVVGEEAAEPEVIGKKKEEEEEKVEEKAEGKKEEKQEGKKEEKKEGKKKE